MRKRAYGFVVFEAVLILVCFFAADDWATEGFCYCPIRFRHAGHALLLADGAGEFTVLAILAAVQFQGRILRRLTESTVGVEEAFCRLVDAEV